LCCIPRYFFAAPVFTKVSPDTAKKLGTNGK
jgi:hypothetical protein